MSAVVGQARCRCWSPLLGTGRSRRRGCSGRAGGHPSSAGRCGQRWWLGVRSTRRPSRRGRAPGVVRRASRCRFSVMGSGTSIPVRWLTSLLRPLMADERPFSRLVPTDQNGASGRAGRAPTTRPGGTARGATVRAVPGRAQAGRRSTQRCSARVEGAPRASKRTSAADASSRCSMLRRRPP